MTNTLPKPEDSAALEALRADVLAWTGLAYYGDRSEDFADRVRYRMAAHGIVRPAEYAAFLHQAETNPASHPEASAERDALVDALTIGETYFFRFQEQFDALRDRILPELLTRNATTRSLTVWCAGCSNGAEPYSVSILLHRYFAAQLQGWRIDILGTDLSPRALRQAERARYLPWSLRGVEPWERETWFDSNLETRECALKAPFRQNVRFARHNLISDPPPGTHWDLIFCRNVLIYFDDATIRRILAGFAGVVLPGGYLLLGHSEPTNLPELQRAFEIIRVPGAHVHRRRQEDLKVIEDHIAALSGVFPEAETPLPTPAVWIPPPLPVVPAPLPLAETATSDAGSDTVRLLLDRGDASGALSALEPLLAKSAMQSRHDPRLHFYQALALEQTGLWDQAEAPLRRALYLDRAFVLAHFHQALQFERRGALTQARRSFANALRLVEPATPKVEKTLIEVGGITSEEMAEVVRLRWAALPPDTDATDSEPPESRQTDRNL